MARRSPSTRAVPPAQLVCTAGSAYQPSAGSLIAIPSLVSRHSCEYGAHRPVGQMLLTRTAQLKLPLAANGTVAE